MCDSDCQHPINRHTHHPKTPGMGVFDSLSVNKEREGVYVDVIGIISIYLLVLIDVFAQQVISIFSCTPCIWVSQRTWRTA